MVYRGLGRLTRGHFVCGMPGTNVGWLRIG